MCIKVNLPNVATFLLLYNLKCGCIFILVWTFVRSFLCLLFFTEVILEVFTPLKLPSGPLLIHQKETFSEDIGLFLYFTLIALVISQAFLFGHTYYLTLGLYYEQSSMLQPYLLCRFVTWLMEIVGLFALCLIHKQLIGWYLGMLVFIILEIYSFIVVYSYYVYLSDYENADCAKPRVTPCNSCI